MIHRHSVNVSTSMTELASTADGGHTSFVLCTNGMIECSLRQALQKASKTKITLTVTYMKLTNFVALRK